jgi:hypothetical protein
MMLLQSGMRGAVSWQVCRRGIATPPTSPQARAIRYAMLTPSLKITVAKHRNGGSTFRLLRGAAVEAPPTMTL